MRLCFRVLFFDFVAAAAGPLSCLRLAQEQRWFGGGPTAVAAKIETRGTDCRMLCLAGRSQAKVCLAVVFFDRPPGKAIDSVEEGERLSVWASGGPAVGASSFQILLVFISRINETPLVLFVSLVSLFAIFAAAAAGGPAKYSKHNSHTPDPKGLVDCGGKGVREAVACGRQLYLQDVTFACSCKW